MKTESKDLNIVAGIVTYNPDLDRLHKNISSIYMQVNKVIVYDNGSKNFSEIKIKLQEINNVEYIESNINNGVAKALKEIMKYSIDNDYEWVLFLDDDSVVKPDLITKYKNYANINNVGIISCIIKDRNYDLPQFDPGLDYAIVPFCITSGSLVKVNAYKNSDGFDENLFIDWVDMDICLDFKVKGYDTIKVNYEGLISEIGNAEYKRIFWKKIFVNNYSAIRRYYRCRNEIIIALRYPQLYKKYPFLRNFIPSAIKIMLFENSKIEKIKSIIKGKRDASLFIKQNKIAARKSNNLINFKPIKELFYY